MLKFYMIRHAFNPEAAIVSPFCIPHPPLDSVFQQIKTFLLSIPTKDSSSSESCPIEGSAVKERFYICTIQCDSHASLLSTLDVLVWLMNQTFNAIS